MACRPLSSGAAGDSYVFSGWAKGRSAALDGLLNGIDKEYALQLTFTNTDGTKTGDGSLSSSDIQTGDGSLSNQTGDGSLS